MEQSAEVQDFLRDKFTAHDLYLYLQKETAALHRRTYELASGAPRGRRSTRSTSSAATRRANSFPSASWDSLHEGLMAGERLSAALRQMEKAYLDENVREYELTKQISLRLHFPAAVPAASNDGRLRDRDSGMDVRPGLSRATTCAGSRTCR